MTNQQPFDDDAPRPPAMDILLPKMPQADLDALIRWAALQAETFPTFAPWLEDLAVGESVRRSDPLTEPAMVEIPQWTHAELADALLGVTVLQRGALTESQTEFVDHLHLHITVCAVSYLQHFTPEAVG